MTLDQRCEAGEAYACDILGRIELGEKLIIFGGLVVFAVIITELPAIRKSARWVFRRARRRFH